MPLNRSPVARLFLVSVVLLVTACGDSLICPAVVLPGLIVNVCHAVTGSPEGDGARVTVTENGFIEDLEPVSEKSFQGTVERAGTYRITVEKVGFATWDRGGVIVDRDECNVRTLTVEVALDPEP